MDPVEHARSLLPWWMTWGQLLILVPLGLVLASILTRVSTSIALLPWRKHGDDHWTVRARLGQAAREVHLISLLSVTGVCAVFFMDSVGPFSPLSKTQVALVGALCGFLAASPVRRRIEIQLVAVRITRRMWIREQVSASVLWGYGPLLILVVAGVTMPQTFDARCIITLLLLAAMLVFLQLGGGLLVLRCVGCIRPAGERAVRAVQQSLPETSQRLPSVSQLKSLQANAVAVLPGQHVIFSDRILEVLDDEELATIAAHETAHLCDPQMRRLSWISNGAAWLGLLPLVTLRPIFEAFGRGTGLVVLGYALCVMIASHVYSGRLRKRMELHADGAGSRHNDNPATYARALEKLYQTNSIPAVCKSKFGHAPLYDRMVAAGVKPDYDRPAPPPRWWPSALAFGFMFGFVLMIAVIWVASATIRMAVLPSDSPAHLIIPGLSMHEAAAVAAYGEARLQAGDLEEGIAMYHAAQALDQSRAFYAADLAIALAELGHCQQAQAAMNEAVDAQQYGDRPRAYHDIEYVSHAQAFVEATCGAVEDPSAPADRNAAKEAADQ